MAKPKIRKDNQGLHIITNGQTYRPGSVNLYGQQRRMDDGGLSAGGTIPATPVEGTELVRITLEDGTVTFWHVDGPTRTRGLMDAPKEAVWKPDGRRDFKRVVIG